GQFQRALDALDDAVTIEPNWNPALVLSIRAMAQHQLGDVEKGSLTLDKARRALVAREEAMLMKGIGYYPRGWQDVVHEQMLYGEACLLIHGSPAPDDARWIVLRGRALRLMGRTAEARDAFDRAFFLQPDNFSLRVSALPELGQGEDFARGLA